MANEAQSMTAVMRNTFDTISASYDNHELRFFRESAGYLVEGLKPRLHGTERVLDVATGTGNVATLLARALPRGQVVGIDISPKMLDQARSKLAELGLTNVELMEMDMQTMAFPDGGFDVVVSAFGIFFAPDIEVQLGRLIAATKPGGRVVLTTFREDYMSPMKEMLMGRLIEDHGMSVPPTTWKLVAAVDACRELCAKAGLSEIEVVEHDCGYHLSSSEEWWQVVWNAGFRRWVAELTPEAREAFKQVHLRDVDRLRTTAGIPLPVPVLYTSGTRTR